MAFNYVLCGDFIEDGECSVAIGANTLEEMIEAAVEHAHSAHAEEDTPALRQAIRRSTREGELAVR